MSDGYLLLRTYHQASSLLFGLSHVCQFLVVHDVALVHCLNHLRILPQGDTHQRHQFGALLLIAFWLGEDHHVSVVADTFEICQGDGVGDTTVEQFVAAHLHHFRGQRHRGGGADPLVALVVGFSQRLIHGLASLHVRADHDKLHRVLLEGFVVEDVVLLGYDMVAKLGVEIVATLQQGAQATIAWVLGKAGVVADGATYLARLVVAAEGRSSRYTDEAVGLNARLHHHVRNACREEPSHGSSFEYKSFLHVCKGTKKISFNDINQEKVVTLHQISVMLRKLSAIGGMLLLALAAWSEDFTDAKCISVMGVPLEGPDSVFIPALKEVGLLQMHPDDAEADTYYFSGDFYGIKSNLMVNVDEKTKLLSSALFTCGPYRTRELYERNQKYLLGKLQREWGNFKAKGDGSASLYLLNDFGYIQQSTPLHDDGSHSIRYFYLNSTPYYKDAANMGLKGQVQEVITENPVAENDINHFDETGKLADDGLVDREYNTAGYLVKAAMIEASGEKSQLTYEYDSDNCLVKRTLINPSSGIRSVNEYHYNTSFEIIQQSQKVFNKDNECILSINMKNDLTGRDDNDNWTENTMQLTYWEKGSRTQIVQVKQTRIISYWDE